MRRDPKPPQCNRSTNSTRAAISKSRRSCSGSARSPDVEDPGVEDLPGHLEGETITRVGGALQIHGMHAEKPATHRTVTVYHTASSRCSTRSTERLAVSTVAAEGGGRKPAKRLTAKSTGHCMCHANVQTAVHAPGCSSKCSRRRVPFFSVSWKRDSGCSKYRWGRCLRAGVSASCRTA